MSLTQYIFWFLSFLALMSSLMVVFTKNAVYSVLCLIITFFAIAGHYLLLNAQFLAAVHIIVYAGAIMVLFLFVIMLMNLNEEFSKAIGADAYCRDAGVAVETAKTLIAARRAAARA